MTYQEFHARSLASPEQFWGDQAKLIHWFKFPESILSKDEHKLYRWYQDGMLNTSYLALDHHVAEGRGDQAARGIVHQNAIVVVGAALGAADVDADAGAGLGAPLCATALLGAAETLPKELPRLAKAAPTASPRCA